MSARERPESEARAPRAKVRALTLLALAEVLAMALWFSASAVVPQLATEWELDGPGRAWLTVSVQLGFVAGALASALGNLPDRISSRALFGVCGLAGAAFTALIAAPFVGHGGALVLRFLTGATLAGVYPPAMKLAASWSLRDRGRAIGLLVGALTVQTSLGFLLTALTVGLLPRGLASFGWSGVLPLLALGPAAGIAATLRLRALPEARRLASGLR